MVCGAIVTADPQTDIFEIPLSQDPSPAARSWNTGLLLGVVSEICHQIRFDPTWNSLNWFHRFVLDLRQAFFVTQSLETRDQFRDLFNECAIAVETTFNSEFFAELMDGWRDGNVDVFELQISTSAPSQFSDIRRLIEERVAETERQTFRAGVVAGEALCWAHYEAGAFLAVAAPRSFEQRLSARDPGPVPSDYELSTTLGDMFEALHWPQRWEEVLAETRSETDVREVSILHAAIALVSLNFSDVAQQQTETSVVEGGYLGITLHANRVATRQGFEIPAVFGGRQQAWDLFSLFVRRQGGNLALRELCSCLGINTTERNCVDQELRFVRDAIGPLELELQNSRGLGWSLRATPPSNSNLR